MPSFPEGFAPVPIPTTTLHKSGDYPFVNHSPLVIPSAAEG